MYRVNCFIHICIRGTLYRQQVDSQRQSVSRFISRTKAKTIKNERSRKSIWETGIVFPAWISAGRWLFRWEKDGITTILTSRSSCILVSSFGRASNVQSEAETGSTFARQSEKRTKYVRKNSPPLWCRSWPNQMASTIDPKLWYFRSILKILAWQVRFLASSTNYFPIKRRTCYSA